jgi:hypothetical protein
LQANRKLELLSLGQIQEMVDYEEIGEENVA